MKCNFCGSEEHDIIAEHTRLEKNNVLQCKYCGLVYLEIKENKQEIEAYYSSDYRKAPELPVQSPEEHYNDKVTRNDDSNRISFITKHIDIKNKRVLEIGSASGNLLDKLKEHGVREAAGVELDKEFSEYARQRGFTVFTRSIEEMGLKEEFDAVVTFHTLEHVYDPMAVIRATRAALKKGGCFLGEVPNQNDWRIKIFDDEVIKRFHYDPNHYYYYSPVTLKNYLETCGFNKISLETVERYNSLTQLRNILCNPNRGKNVEGTLKKYIYPETDADDVRLPDLDNRTESEFNRVFEAGVNSELMGNCLRWVACK
jgi:2-polyprenyl-3-methyl-5-hydroxy-6-metoxy-1,4-benzoquinol methylase